MNNLSKNIIKNFLKVISAFLLIFIWVLFAFAFLSFLNSFVYLLFYFDENIIVKNQEKAYFAIEILIKFFAYFFSIFDDIIEKNSFLEFLFFMFLALFGAFCVFIPVIAGFIAIFIIIKEYNNIIILKSKAKNSLFLIIFIFLFYIFILFMNIQFYQVSFIDFLFTGLYPLYFTKTKIILSLLLAFLFTLLIKFILDKISKN